MKRSIDILKTSKLIPFKINGTFYHKKAQKHLYNNNYSDALCFFRKAVETEPENIEYRLELAKVFNEMDYYDDSNRMLYLVLQIDQSKSDCFFGLGCNYLALREYDKAENAFLKYLELDENGIYADDSHDFLDMLQNSDEESEEEILEVESKAKLKLFKLSNKGRALLDAGNYQKAIKYLEKVVTNDKSFVFVRNNLALAYYCAGQIEKAIALTRQVLLDVPQNVHANCNLSLMLNDKEHEDELDSLKRKILELKIEDPDGIHKIALTLCELKMHAEANKELQKLIRFSPYDVKLLHYLALSFYNLKQFKQALRLWNKIEKLAPENMISNYYLSLALDVLNDKVKFSELSYYFQVPYDEILERVNKIYELTSLDTQVFAQKWKSTLWPKRLLAWGLNLSKKELKEKILMSVASVGDLRSEYFLRELCLHKNIETSLKNSASMHLNRIGAKEPFLAYIDDEISDISKVGISNAETFHISENIIIVATSKMQDRYTVGFEKEITKIWYNYFYSLEKESINVRQIETWAAALEMTYCASLGIKFKGTEIIKNYNAKYATALSYFKKMSEMFL